MITETKQQTKNMAAAGQTADVEPVETPAKRKERVTFERQLNRYRTAIELSLGDETLKQYAAEFGYSPERIGHAQTLLQETETLYGIVKSRQADQWAASRALREAREKADVSISHFVQTARLAFKDQPDVLDALGLKGNRKRAFGDWAVQGKLFYDRILTLPQAVEEIGKYNVTLEQLNAGKEQFMETLAAETRQKSAKGDAQHATELKNKAFRKLRTWMALYLKVMKVALGSEPQLQEKLGIVVPYDPQ